MRLKAIVEVKFLWEHSQDSLWGFSIPRKGSRKQDAAVRAPPSISERSLAYTRARELPVVDVFGGA